MNTESTGLLGTLRSTWQKFTDVTEVLELSPYDYLQDRVDYLEEEVARLEEIIRLASH